MVLGYQDLDDGIRIPEEGNLLTRHARVSSRNHGRAGKLSHASDHANNYTGCNI